MTDDDRIRWRLGLIIFKALSATLAIHNLDRKEAAKAFRMAANEIENEAPPIVPDDSPTRWWH